MALDNILNDNETQELIIEHISFIKQYTKMFNFKMIKIFQLNILNELPEDWKEFWLSERNSNVFELNFSNASCHSLREFALNCMKYSMDGHCGRRFHIKLPSAVNFNNSSKLDNVCPKKSHEIDRLVSLIDSVGMTVDCKRVLDIGSGLGYVDLCLHKDQKYVILGLESNEEHVKAANNLKRKNCSLLCPNIDYKTWKLTDESIKSIETHINDVADRSSSCCCSESNGSPKRTGSAMIISLHACGDLTPLIMKMFINQPALCAAVVLPCCYHKASEFMNFPMSDRLESLMLTSGVPIDCYGLRLAAEESLDSVRKKSKEEFMQDVRCISFRAILQTVCDREMLSMQKLKRRCTKKNSFKTFEEYVTLALTNYKISKNGIVLDDVELTTVSDKLRDEYSRCKDHIQFIGLVRALQLHLQPVIETLIHLDKLFYLVENGITDCGLFPLFNKTLSPRNTAIVCFR